MRTILVTGATGGIGGAVCERLAASGTRLILAARDEARLESVALTLPAPFAWVGEAKTLAFALGERGIHVNTLSLGGTLSPWYRDAIAKRAANAGVSLEERLASETDNIPLKKYGTPSEVATVVAGTAPCLFGGSSSLVGTTCVA